VGANLVIEATDKASLADVTASVYNKIKR